MEGEEVEDRDRGHRGPDHGHLTLSRAYGT